MSDQYVQDLEAKIGTFFLDGSNNDQAIELCKKISGFDHCCYVEYCQPKSTAAAFHDLLSALGADGHELGKFTFFFAYGFEYLVFILAFERASDMMLCRMMLEG